MAAGQNKKNSPRYHKKRLTSFYDTAVLRLRGLYILFALSTAYYVRYGSETGAKVRRIIETTKFCTYESCRIAENRW